MHKHHEKLVQMFELKIEEAEKIAGALIEQSMKESKSDGCQKEQIDFKQMKIKIFDICKMIYDEQKTAGMQLR